MERNPGRTVREETNPRLSRILTTTSGNAQSSALQYQHRNESHDAFSAHGVWPSKYQDTLPKHSMPSNDRRALSRQKLNVRRIKRRIRLAEKYLLHPKFLEFKARPRKDVDKTTQEVIWSEETETAFQNAIINIPAMGRRKKSQHGKTFGRNELIMEWIKQETGRHRTRKQVSSHIQTLEKMFEPKEEEGFAGRMLSRGTDDSISDYDEPDFYENSIADMVRDWKILRTSLFQQDNSFGSYQYQHQHQHPLQLTIRADPSSSSSVSSLDFAMWVSSPDKVKKAIHRYTRIQSNQTTAAPEPLENIKGWRNKWPALATVVDCYPHVCKFDVVLLEASLDLMLDFPPPGSKLASSIELNFATTGCENIFVDANPWRCITRIYHKGQLELETDSSNCHSPGLGRVKIPFESKWWAEQFTRLTEKRRHAVDSDNEAAIVAVDEVVRNYLTNLTVMQHITKSSSVDVSTQDFSTVRSIELEPGVVLLWTFSQVASGFVGTTTWRRLIPPPPRATVNSPIVSAIEPRLPDLDLATTIDTNFVNNDFESEPAFLTYGIQSNNNGYLPASDDELCQDGFMIAAHQNTYSSFAGPSDHLDWTAHNQVTFQSNLLCSLASQGVHGNAYDKDGLTHEHPRGAKGDEHHHDLDQPPSLITEPHHYSDTRFNFDVVDTQSRSAALRSFDVNTSRMLQAQLEQLNYEEHVRDSISEPPLQPHHSDYDQRGVHSNISRPEEITPAGVVESFALSATSENNLTVHIPTDEKDANENSYQPVRIPLSKIQADDTVGETYIHDQNPSNQARRAARPALHHHHTFAGVLPTISLPFSCSLTVPTPSSIDDNLTRNDFALLMENIYDPNIDFFDNNSHFHSFPSGYRPGSAHDEGIGLGLGIPRACSQPPPGALFPGFPILMSNNIEIDSERKCTYQNDFDERMHFKEGDEGAEEDLGDDFLEHDAPVGTDEEHQLIKDGAGETAQEPDIETENTLAVHDAGVNSL